MKILVELRVPSIGAKYELFIPSFLPIKQVIEMLSKGVEELSDGGFTPSGEEFLCLEGAPLPMNYEYTLDQYSIQNGDTLLLI